MRDKQDGAEQRNRAEWTGDRCYGAGAQVTPESAPVPIPE